jgi:hypothetical protein
MRFGVWDILRGLAVVSMGVAAVAMAQSDADFKTMDKARAVYFTGPVPASISCGVALDWSAFFKSMKMEETDESKARLEKLKATKMTVVSTGSTQTEVKVQADDSTPGSLVDGLKQQLQGLFQIYWSEAYGRLVPKRGDTFELSTRPAGYLVKATAGPMKTTIAMDKNYLITQFGATSEQLNADTKPGFVAGTDGLLRLRQIDETVDLGASKMVIAVSLDYQKVGAFEVPQHVAMSLPGSFRFDYTLSGCVVKGEVPAGGGQ